VIRGGGVAARLARKKGLYLFRISRAVSINREIAEQVDRHAIRAIEEQPSILQDPFLFPFSRFQVILSFISQCFYDV